MDKDGVNKTKPVILIILDGWGIAPPSKGNAITLAKTPFIKHLVRYFPSTQLKAAGRFVGLPKNQVGNSEAGHLNLGAGRIVKDDAVVISESINDGSFFRNSAFIQAVKHFKKYHSKIHLMGLITETNSAHSSPEHWQAMTQFLTRQGVKKIYLHLFTDGRDSPQHDAIEIIKRFQKRIQSNHCLCDALIASISGRFYAMDRTKNWSRIGKVYQAMILGRGLEAASAEEAIIQAYNRQETDEFIQPTIIKKDHQPVALIEDNDAVIFMNLRSDRARELTKAFVQKEFNKKNLGSFIRQKFPNNLFFVALTDFGPDLDNTITAYPGRRIQNSLPIVLGPAVRQIYLAETEKYAHVTFFFNGGYDHLVANEERIMVPSLKVKSYDLMPKMSAPEIFQIVLKKIKDQKFDFLAVNFANPDMLGHTGNLEATIKGIEYLDQCLKKIILEARNKKINALITADHGNAEEMINLKTGEILTSHTSNPVPFILVANEYKKRKLRKDGILGDVAPTILEIMGIKKPKEMTGKSLMIT